MVLLSPEVAGSIVTGTGLLTEGSYSATPLVINVEAATTQASSTAVIYPAQSERNVVQHAAADATSHQTIFKVNHRSHTLEDDPIAIPVPLPGDEGTYMQIGAVDGPPQITNTAIFVGRWRNAFSLFLPPAGPAALFTRAVTIGWIRCHFWYIYHWSGQTKQPLPCP